VALGAVFLAEPLTSNVLVGGAVIIGAVASVITVESRTRRRPAQGLDAGVRPVEPT